MSLSTRVQTLLLNGVKTEAQAKSLLQAAPTATDAEYKKLIRAISTWVKTAKRVSVEFQLEYIQLDSNAVNVIGKNLHGEAQDWLIRNKKKFPDEFDYIIANAVKLTDISIPLLKQLYKELKHGTPSKDHKAQVKVLIEHPSFAAAPQLVKKHLEGMYVSQEKPSRAKRELATEVPVRTRRTSVSTNKEAVERKRKVVRPASSDFVEERVEAEPKTRATIRRVVRPAMK